jgi:hypothetical protein
VRLRRWDNWARAAGFITIFTSIVACSFLYAISYPPIPSHGPVAKHNEGSANTETQATGADQRGTKAVPLAIEIVPPKEGTPEAERNERESHQKAANERGLVVATWVLTFATALLFIAASVQAGLFVWQLSIMRDGMNDARIAAEAAKISADALMKAQRAYVRLSHVGGMTLQIADETAVIQIQLQAKNWGETPAIVTSVAIGPIFLAPSQKLPPNPSYPPASVESSLLLRNEEMFRRVPIPIDVADAGAVQSGTMALYLVGYIDYIDAFKVRHRGGYAREYDGRPAPGTISHWLLLLRTTMTVFASRAKAPTGTSRIMIAASAARARKGRLPQLESLLFM